MATRRLIPLIAVIPLGIAVGLLSASQDWSTPTRILVVAAGALIIVGIGTPFALRPRRVPPPASGKAGVPGYRLAGIFSANRITPGLPPAGALSGPGSADPTVLLPVIPDLTTDRGRTIERVIVIPANQSVSYYAQLNRVPYDLALWPERGRRRPLRWIPRRAYMRLRSRGWGRSGERSEGSATPPEHLVDRLTDQTTA
jgi:hypothetical protein